MGGNESGVPPVASAAVNLVPEDDPEIDVAASTDLRDGGKGQPIGRVLKVALVPLDLDQTGAAVSQLLLDVDGVPVGFALHH